MHLPPDQKAVLYFTPRNRLTVFVICFNCGQSESHFRIIKLRPSLSYRIIKRGCRDSASPSITLQWNWRIKISIYLLTNRYIHWYSGIFDSKLSYCNTFQHIVCTIWLTTVVENRGCNFSRSYMMSSTHGNAFSNLGPLWVDSIQRVSNAKRWLLSAWTCCWNKSRVASDSKHQYALATSLQWKN